MTEGFSYSEVEAVLAVVFDAQSSEVLPKLRARYKKLRNLGVPSGETPSRGKRSRYSLGQMLEIILCMELVEFGMDYEVIEYIHREKIFHEEFNLSFKTFAQAEEEDFLRVMYFNPSMMSYHWEKKKPERMIGIDTIDGAIFKCRLDKVSRICIINLAALAERTLDAIAEVNIHAYASLRTGDYFVHNPKA